MFVTEQEKKEIESYPIKDALERLGINFKKTGSGYVTNCPLPCHGSDSSPSFSLKIDTNTWKCFGCNEGRTIIDFIQKYYNIPFIDALEEAAKITGVTISNKNSKENEKYKKYKELMTNHAKRYHQNLYSKNNKSAEKALNYLYSRGIVDETIKEFGLGCVPDDEYKTRKDLGFINGRISFPIQEMTNGEPLAIGMGYRTMQDILNPMGYDSSKCPKYMNDKNIDGMFVKGDTFYGYGSAYPYIRMAKYAIIVEGYFDTLALHQSGIKNVLGVMTATMTDNMIATLTKLTNSVILFLDKDKTGIANSAKLIPKLIKKGLDVKIYFSEDGKDAADLCKKANFDKEEVFNSIISNAEYGIHFLIEKASNNYTDVVTRERMNTLRTLLPILNSLPEEARIVYTDMLYKKIDIRC